MRILAFGDSITYGSWDKEGGWVERLKKRAHTTTVLSEGANKVQVINLGIGGNTSANLLSRIESEIENRTSASWRFLFIIAIGTNDGRRSADGRSEVSIDEYRENINTIITLAKKYTDKILVVGLPPLGAEILNFKDVIYSDKDIRAYDAVLQEAASLQDVVYAATRPLFEESNSTELFCYDLLHPSDEGHALIAESVGVHLEKMGVDFNI